MYVLKQLIVAIPCISIVLRLFLLAFLQLVTHRTLDLGNLDQLRFELLEYLVLLSDDFRSIYIVPLQCLQEALVQFCLVDGLIGR